MITAEQLHTIKDFDKLFQDERFVALKLFLLQNRPKASQKEPHGMIQDSGKMDAYFLFLDKLEEAENPPKAPKGAVERGLPYASETLSNNR